VQNEVFSIKLFSIKPKNVCLTLSVALYCTIHLLHFESFLLNSIQLYKWRS